jgi:AraC-like DNA-binding protein
MITLTNSIFFQSMEEVDDYPHQWDANFSALQPGRNTFHMQETLLPHTAIRTGSFSGPVLQRGEVPRSMRTFAFLTSASDGHCFRGQEVGADDIMVFGSDLELDACSSSPQTICTISIDTQYLYDRISSWDANLDCDLGQIQHMCPQLKTGLIRDINRVATFQRDNSEQSVPEQLREGEAIADSLISALAAGQLCAEKSAPTRQQVLRALDYINANLDRPIRVSELTEELGVSRRTLQLQFRKHLNATPKQVIDQLRLSSLRRDMLKTPTRLPWAATFALEHGYWHLSQLAKDYFLAFGETPKHTLKAAKRSKRA